MNPQTERHAACCELLHHVARSVGEVRLKVAGASMLPSVWPGDLLTVQSCALAELAPGDIALYRRDGKLTAHRVMSAKNDRLTTRGDSVPSFDPPAEPDQIVGRVTTISRNGRILSPKQSLLQRAASFLLRRSHLLMRATLFLGRRLRRTWELQPSWTTPSPLPQED